ncbi:hypothetical protein LP419_09960 [Massilia sp. H-1]|nr:hypothetical protein LP419_09960 [Massilia sp. H-1]
MLGMALPFGYRQLSDWMATLVPEYAVQIDKGLGFLCAALVAVFVVIPLMKQFDRPS